MGLRVISKQSRLQTMSPDARPQAIEHSAECERLTIKRFGRLSRSRMRDDVKRMVSIIEEAGGSLAYRELKRRMDETGGSQGFGDIHATAWRNGLLYKDDLDVFHVPKKEPVSTPEGRAELSVYLKAERLGIVRWTGHKRSVVVDDPDACPLTREELETVERFIIEGDALSSSPEVDRMYDLYREGKATKAEVDACMKEVARLATETPLQEQRGSQGRKARTPAQR